MGFLKRVPLPVNYEVVMPNGGIYCIDQLINQGGFSLVYHAHTKGENTKVVIKEFYPDEYGCRDLNPSSKTYNRVIPVDKEYRDLFEKSKESFDENEGRFGGSLWTESSQVVAFSQSGDGYAVMPKFSKDMYSVLDIVQYWEKETLKSSERNNEDTLKIASSLKIIDSLLDVVDVFHSSMNTLHLDLTATNVLFATKSLTDVRNGRVYLTDFGSCAEMRDGIYIPNKYISYSEGYSAPEVMQLETLSVQSDIFSVGAILYLLCVGESATIDWKLLEITSNDIRYEIEELQVEDRIRDLLIDLLQKSCARNPEQRYQSAKKMQQAVKRILDEIEQEQATNKIFQSVNTFTVQPHTLYEGTYIERTEQLGCVDDILHKESSEKNYCIIKGVGGTGKTELAKAYAWNMRTEYNKVFVLACPEKHDVEYDILSLLVNSQYMIKKEHFDERMAEELFMNLDKRVLLIIDNCNCINNNFIRTIEEKTGNADVIITTRSGCNHLKIDSQRVLEIENNDQQFFAFEVFCKNYYVSDKKKYSVEDEKVMIDICKMAMYNPLILSMIAIQSREFGLELSELKRRMEVSLKNAELDGAEILYNDKEGSVSELIKAYFSDILCYDFNLFQKSLLTILCMMPAESINSQFLYQVLGDIPGKCAYMKSAGDKLGRLNWIQRTDESVAIHPLLAEVLNSYGGKKLIVDDERKELCNHVLKNWLLLDEKFQKEDMYLIHMLWEQLKPEGKYKKINLMMSVLLDKISIENYWKKLSQSKKYFDFIFYTIQYSQGRIYGVWNIRDEKTEILYEIKRGKNPYWSSDYCVVAESYKNIKTNLLYLYLSTENDIKLPDEVEGFKVVKIDDGFARNNKKVGIVKFPAYVEEVGSWAFAGSTICDKLVLPETLNEIGDYAFTACEKLNGDLLLPKKLKKLGKRSFSGCSGFDSKLVLPEKIERLEEGTFCGCTGLASILHLPDSINYIGRECFGTCRNLKGEIKIPDNVHFINEYTFYMCEKIEKVISSNSLIEIRDGAFWGCKKMYSFLFHDKLKKILERAFRDCSSLNCQLKLPDSLVYIGQGAFSGCGFSGDLILPEKLEILEAYAFEYCRGLTGELKINSNLKRIEESTFAHCSFNGELIIPEGIKSIGEFAFSCCNNITSIKLPDSLESMGNGAFIDCRNFKGDIKVPSSIRYWGHSVFAGCNGGLEELVFPHNVSNLSGLIKEIIEKNNDFGEVINDDYDGWGDCDWEDERNRIAARKHIEYFFDEKLNIQSNITTIGNYEFADNLEIKGQISFQNSCLQSIGQGAFRGCIGLCGTLVLPESLKTIDLFAFAGCKNMTGRLILPEQLKTIEAGVFYETGFSGKLKLPSHLEVIGWSAFQKCINLKGELHIPSHMKRIDMEAFAGCKGLEGVLIIPESVEYIGVNAFYKCSFTKIVFMGKETIITRPIIGDEFGCETVIVGKKDSTAYRYAQQFNCPFEPYDKSYDLA